MYEMKRNVTYSQVGSGLTMDMAGVVHFLQDCTLAHSEGVGKGLSHVAQTKRAWFLSSWQIEVERYPKYQEEVTVRTWAHDFKSMYGYRNFDILDVEGTRIVRANSIWIFMDLEKMSPAKPTDEDMAGYDIEPALDMEYAPRKIKLLPEEFRVGVDGIAAIAENGKNCGTQNASCELPHPGSPAAHEIDMTAEHVAENKRFIPGIVVRKSFLDSNQHVNNGRYVSEALDLIGKEDVKRLRVDYRRAAVLGDVMYPAVYENDDLIQVSLNDSYGNPYVIVEANRYS